MKWHVINILSMSSIFEIHKLIDEMILPGLLVCIFFFINVNYNMIIRDKILKSSFSCQGRMKEELKSQCFDCIRKRNSLLTDGVKHLNAYILNYVSWGPLLVTCKPWKFFLWKIAIVIGKNNTKQNHKMNVSK